MCPKRKEPDSGFDMPYAKKMTLFHQDTSLTDKQNQLNQLLSDAGIQNINIGIYKTGATNEYTFLFTGDKDEFSKYPLFDKLTDMPKESKNCNTAYLDNNIVELYVYIPVDNYKKYINSIESELNEQIRKNEAGPAPMHLD